MAVELASGYVSIVPSTKGFGAALDKQIGPEVDKAARDAGARAGDGFTSSFGAGLGKLAAVAATAFAGLQIGNFFKGAILAASDLNETISKVNVVFGDSAGVVEAWGKTAVDAMGLSKQQALESAATFGNLFRAMGLTSGVSADMSTKIVQLAGDLASFNNITDPTEVLQALQSGLVGETEPLRRFGVNINDARLKAEALSLGLTSATVDQDKLSAAQEAADKAARKVTEALQKHGQASQEFSDATRDAEQANSKLADVLGGKMPTQLDAATKAQAAYALIMQDTTLAQGDFERTGGGLANQLRKLSAHFKESSADIGQALLPTFTKIVTFINTQVFPAFTKLGVAVSTKLGHVFDAVVASPGLAKFGKAIEGTLAFIYFRIFDFVKAVTPLFREFRALFGDLAKRLSSGSGGLLAAIRKLTIGGTALITRFFLAAAGAVEIFRQTLSKSVKAVPGIKNLNDVFAHLADFVGAAIDKLKAFGRIVKTAFDAFSAGFNGTTGAAGAIGVFERIGAVARQVFTETIPNLINDSIKAFDAFVKGFKDGFKDGVTSLDGSGLQGRIEDIAGQVGALAHFLKTDVPEAIGAFVDGFRNGFDDINKGTKFERVEKFGDTVKSIVETIKDNKDVFGAIAGAITGFATALVVVSKVSPVFSTLSGLLGNLGTVVGILTSPLGIIVGLIAGLAAAAFFAYKKFTPFKAAVDSVAQTFKQSGFGAAVEEAGTQFGRLFEIVKPKLIEFRDKAFAWIGDHAGEILAGIGTAFVGALGLLRDQVLVPLGNWVLQTGLPFLKDKFGEWASAAVGWIEDTALPALQEKLPALVDRIIGFLQENEPKVLDKFNAFADGAVNWIEDKALPGLQEKLPGIFAALVNWANENLPEWGRQLGLLALDAVGRITASIVEHLPDLFLTIPAELAAAGLGIIAGIIAGAIGPEATQKLEDISTNIIAFVSGLPGRISDAATGMWDGITEAFRTAINAIIDIWNGLHFRLEIPDKVFGVSVPGGGRGIDFQAPPLEHLAGGGVFDKATTGFFQLAETPAARPEIVTPQKLLAATFRKELATVGAGGGGGVQFGDIVVNGAQASPQSIADAVFAKAGWLHFTGRREL